MCSPWACRTTSMSPSKRVRLACALGQRFSETEAKLSYMFSLREDSTGVSFAVKVHPRARKNAITGELGDALKLSLTAPPVDGKANEACIEFFSKLLKVPRSSVTIASGLTSRNKVVRITGLSGKEVEQRLKIASPRK